MFNDVCSNICCPPQKILFCSSVIGKQAIVRQIRPQLHVDCKYRYKTLGIRLPQSIDQHVSSFPLSA